MKSTRMVTAAALALGAALAFTGCASGDAATTDTASTSTVDACKEVRNVTNGALNTLAGDITTDPTATADYFTELAGRVDALVGTVENKKADDAFTAFSASLTAAAEYVPTAVAPAEDAVDADPALVATATAVQDAATEAAANCK